MLSASIQAFDTCGACWLVWLALVLPLTVLLLLNGLRVNVLGVGIVVVVVLGLALYRAWGARMVA